MHLLLAAMASHCAVTPYEDILPLTSAIAMLRLQGTCSVLAHELMDNNVPGR